MLATIGSGVFPSPLEKHQCEVQFLAVVYTATQLAVNSAMYVSVRVTVKWIRRGCPSRIRLTDTDRGRNRFPALCLPDLRGSLTVRLVTVEVTAKRRV